MGHAQEKIPVIAMWSGAAEADPAVRACRDHRLPHHEKLRAAALRP
ncbi:hypothetical protein LG634_04865 [Streptomyces bambusae]|nr:hypothetical protein [Streptomyces bambusae]MCB5164167.1 hypothetical protein [Streptomyces bambusae]